MNIRKIISGITAVLVLAGAVPVLSANPVQDYAVTASAADYDDDYIEGTYENLTYKKYSDHIEITGCDKSATEVIIPAEIDGLPVTSIGNSAFSLCDNLTSITIPDSVTSIGGWAFSLCYNLKSITIPDSVTSIGDDAFAFCSNLTSIALPDSVTSIGECAFSYCSVKSITIPNGVTSIGNGVFNFSGLTSITIPDSVTSIGHSAFFGCSNLTEITIPDSVTSIGVEAFFDCSSLKSITIPDGVTDIGDYMFAGCSSFESITISNNVTSIGKGAFYYCENLESITILNPDCEINDDSSTICNECDDDDDECHFNGTIKGYENSTAQEYAEKYGYKFEAIAEGEIPETLLGDANCDGEISVADATLVLQYCGNKDKYKLNEQGLINADVDGTAGISAVDALRIQQYDAGVITEF